MGSIILRRKIVLLGHKHQASLVGCITVTDELERRTWPRDCRSAWRKSGDGVKVLFPNTVFISCTRTNQQSELGRMSPLQTNKITYIEASWQRSWKQRDCCHCSHTLPHPANHLACHSLRTARSVWLYSQLCYHAQRGYRRCAKMYCLLRGPLVTAVDYCVIISTMRYC